MPYWINELINLLLRWLHVVAGIFWIGQTALFTWLETRMRVERDEQGAEVWMVHGGGFYRVQKLPFQAPERTLHWFKWEAALTWLSGMLLFAWVYYYGRILVGPDSGLTLAPAIGVSAGVFVLSWLVYDTMWRTKLERHPLIGTVISLALLTLLTWILARLFSSRAVYLQIGATLGTIMTANVWLRILPAMRRLLAAAEAGEVAGPELRAQGARAALRSKHNTFIVFPVVLLMISHHYPVTTYGHSASWAILALVFLVGFLARWLLDRHEAG